MTEKIQVIYGPNLNLLGRREATHYGNLSLADIDSALKKLALELCVELSFFQSNLEGELINQIHQCGVLAVNGILINPGGYGHTSIALRDALAAVALPFVEVHMSNIYAREEFRHKTYLSDLAAGIVIGLGSNSYALGLRGLVDRVRNSS